MNDRTKDTPTKPAAVGAPIAGWGNYPIIEGVERSGEDLEAITKGVSLTRGLGRSYGDASLPSAKSAVVAATPLADRFLSFDESTGLLRAEAGCPLWRINRTFLSRCWFTPVTPGTHFVTLGGMVAADVHGKMHHSAGCFGEHVTALRLRVADGRIIECSDQNEPELFRATIGGMGLTGHILEVEFRMRRIPSPWMWQETEKLASLEELLNALERAGKDWPFTVTWSDLLISGPGMGRGLLMKARWAEPNEAPPEPPKFRAPISVPPIFPSWAMRPWMLRLFNLLVYNVSRPGSGIVSPESNFYPLDVLRNWNNFYGRRGFTQYQCVLPTDAGMAAHHRFLEVLRAHRAPVVLTVIKDCGPEGKGMLSFPRAGVSYAIDVPVNERTQALVDALNEVVMAAGGRIYLAKDAFTRPEHFRAMETRLDAFTAVRDKWDPQHTLRSAQSVRLLGDKP